MENKPISIGFDNYKQMVDKEYYYIDKSLFIIDLLDKGGAVNVIHFGGCSFLIFVVFVYEKST